MPSDKSLKLQVVDAMKRDSVDHQEEIKMKPPLLLPNKKITTDLEIESCIYNLIPPNSLFVLPMALLSYSSLLIVLLEFY